MIYICYGITKSASTYLYQMTEEVFRATGRPVVRLGKPFRKADSVENYFNFITPETLNEIEAAIGKRDIVLKTHGPPIASVAERIAAGNILASASIRDPREIALSMIDHGARARRWGIKHFTEFGEASDTLNALDIQIGLFESWAAIHSVRIFRYNDICYDSDAVVAGIAEQIGAEVDPQAVLGMFRSKTTIGQFSKGKALRYSEMSQSDQAMFLQRYSLLYQSYEFDTERARLVAEEQKGKALRPAGELIQQWINFRRRFRI